MARGLLKGCKHKGPGSPRSPGLRARCLWQGSQRGPQPSPQGALGALQASLASPPSEVIFRLAHTRWKKRPGHLTAKPGGPLGSSGNPTRQQFKPGGAARQGRDCWGQRAPRKDSSLPWPRRGATPPPPAPPSPRGTVLQAHPRSVASLTPSGPGPGWSGSPTSRGWEVQPLSPGATGTKDHRLDGLKQQHSSLEVCSLMSKIEVLQGRAHPSLQGGPFPPRPASRQLASPGLWPRPSSLCLVVTRPPSSPVSFGSPFYRKDTSHPPPMTPIRAQHNLLGL